MNLSKLTALAALSLVSLLTPDGQALADVNFVAPGVVGSVTNLTVGADVYDVTFINTTSHIGWAAELDFTTEAEAQEAIVALAAELNAAGATTTRYTTASGTFDFTTGQVWYDADATSLFGETLIKSGSTWLLANPFPGGATAPLNGAFPLAIDFTLVTPSVWTDIGFGLAGVSGVPDLVGTGTLVSGSAGSLELTGARASSPAALFMSVASTPVPFKGGTLVPVPITLQIPVATDATGALTLPFVWPASVPSGTSLWFQYAVSDVAAVQNVSLSNAFKATTP